MTTNAPGTLFLVSTPLGNPRDLSPRAVDVLRALDVLYAEDTRSAQRLLAEQGLSVPTRSCFDANEGERAQEVVARLAEGAKVGLVSEAGTPAVSDPGYRVVRAAIDAGARVVPIPGPSAVLAALVASGLPPDRFFFLGFPPRKPGARKALFSSLRALPATLVLYESPLRAGATLADLRDTLGPDRPACLARELTKIHEELVRDSLAGLAARYAEDRPLGEITLVVGGAAAEQASGDDEEIQRRAAELLAEGHTAREVALRLTAESGRPRREVYDLVLAARDRPEGD